MKNISEIVPVFIQGEPLCSGEKCPRYPAYCAGQSSIDPVEGRPCIPGLRQQRDTAAKTVLLESMVSLDDQAQVNSRLLQECLAKDQEIERLNAELAKAVHDLENKELTVQEKTCAECQREAETENRRLEEKLVRLRAELDTCILDRDKARRYICEQERGVGLEQGEEISLQEIAETFNWTYLYCYRKV